MLFAGRLLQRSLDHNVLAQPFRPRSLILEQYLTLLKSYRSTRTNRSKSMSPAGTPITISSAIQHDLTNSQTGLNYRIQISWPHNWKRTTQLRENKIPVIYVLDGNSLFLTASEILWRSASNSFYNGGGIVVAIGYQNIPTETGSLFSSQRNTDLTPREHEVHPGLGGADAFLNFVEREVRTLVRRQFGDVSIGEEALFGHSFGGLCVLHALFSKKGGDFDAYYAASPSIWWDQAIVQEADAYCSDKNQELEITLQLSYGVLEATPKITSGESSIGFEERETRCKERKMGENAVVMEKKLRKSAKLKDVSIIAFEEEDHCTVATSALLRAMSTFFGR